MLESMIQILMTVMITSLKLIDNLILFYKSCAGIELKIGIALIKPSHEDFWPANKPNNVKANQDVYPLNSV